MVPTNKKLLKVKKISFPQISRDLLLVWDLVLDPEQTTKNSLLLN